MDPKLKKEYNGELLNFFLFSGTNINDLGEYDSCVNSDDKTYILTKILLPEFGKIQFYLGLCYFKECNSTYLDKTKPAIINMVQNNFNRTLKENQIIFQNPEEQLSNLRDKYLFRFIIFFSIFVIIIFFNFLQLFVRENNIILQFKKFILNIEENQNQVEGQKELYTKDGGKLSISYSKIETNSDKKEFSFEITKNEPRIISINDINEAPLFIPKDEEKITEKISEKITEKISEKITERKSPFNVFLENFDIFNNAKSIFKFNNINQTVKHLRIFDGIRVFASFWVIWAHTFSIAFAIGFKNFYAFLDLTKEFKYSFLLSGFIAVDVFFYISGFLLYYNLEKLLNSKKINLKFYLMSIFHRYLRLLPIYLLAMFVIVYFYPFASSGPIYSEISIFIESCDQYWWSNLLYIHNFMDYSKTNNYMCVGHSWYLADDMQYFILFSFIIIFLNNKKLIKNLILVALFIASSVVQVIVCLNKNYSLSAGGQKDVVGDYFYDYYIQPWARVTPYILGIFYCELFLETELFLNDRKIEKCNQTSNCDDNDQGIAKKINDFLEGNNFVCILVLIVSLCFTSFTIVSTYLVQNYTVGYGFQAFLITFNKVFFIIGLGNIMHLVFLGKLKILKEFLAHETFGKISRLSYGIYILHYFSLGIFFYGSVNLMYMDFFELSIITTAFIFITIFISYFMSILFESPLANLLKILDKTKKK